MVKHNGHQAPKMTRGPTLSLLNVNEEYDITVPLSRGQGLSRMFFTLMMVVIQFNLEKIQCNLTYYD